jgi:hypothetical protein
MRSARRTRSGVRPIAAWYVAALLVLGGGLPDPAMAQDGNFAAWIEWARGLEPDGRSVQEVLRFGEATGAALDQDYAPVVVRQIHEELLRGAEERVAQLLQAGCEPFTQVTFGSAGHRPSDGTPVEAPRTDRFEKGLVRVESVTCVDAPGVGAAHAMAVYTDSAFRMSVEGRIRAVREAGDESCVETAGVMGLLLPSEACNRIRRFLRGPLASEHSQVVSNPGSGSHQIVYLKESLKTFVETPSGIAIHYLNYSRTAEVGRVGRWAAERSIRDAEKRRADGLQRRLAADSQPGTPGDVQGRRISDSGH